MSGVDEKAIKERFYGADGAEVHGLTIDLLHRFAQLTNCPAGHDVIAWYSHMTGVWQEACEREYRRTRNAPPARESEGGSE